jgi:alkanesulfonate monooxygenase SsuD/methylene tetrahydromethanopterin reductase-like flavin-dependent oxidoreductase (luciferase family)
MEIGIGLPNPVPGTPGRMLVDWAKRAEERGFSSLATIDRVAYPSYESLIALAAAAAVTERIRLLSNVVVATTRNPVLLAKEAASVDQISGGRFTLGVGVGGREDDNVASRTSFRNRGEYMEEMLEIMHRAWRGEPVEGSPKPVTPMPVRDAKVPVLIGGYIPLSAERAARWGIGWSAGGLPPEQVGAFVPNVHEAWKKAGRSDTPRIVALAYFSLGDEHTDASRGYLKDYYSNLGEYADTIADSAFRSPEALKAGIQAFADAGVDELILDPTVADIGQVDRLADAVL